MCAWIRPTPTATTVVILQHPAEVAHAKNTARLLHLSLPNSHLWVGKSWDATTWATAGLCARSTLLLYPRTDANVGTSADPHAGTQPCTHPAESGAAPQPGVARCLVVLDGSWRQSRQLLRASPVLQGLKRLSLDEVPASRYAIRQAHRPGQLSTFEATCAALALLEGPADARWPALMAGFDGFVAQLRARMPGR